MVAVRAVVARSGVGEGVAVSAIDVWHFGVIKVEVIITINLHVRAHHV